jgi:hypothetical protein
MFAAIAKAGAAETGPSLQPVGAFGAIVQHGEECTGTTVSLWRAGARWFGVFQQCDGLLDAKVNVAFAREPAPSAAAPEFKIAYESGIDILPDGREKKANFAISIRYVEAQRAVELDALNVNSKLVTTSKLRRRQSALEGFASPAELLSFEKTRLGALKVDGVFGR